MILNSADKKSVNYFLKKMNGYLEADQLDLGKFSRTLKRFEKRFNPKIGVVDFKYFDENRLKKARRERLKAEKFGSHQFARTQRRLERVCQQYLVLKTQYGIDKSKFIYEEKFLLYCHCGTSKNDAVIMQRILYEDRYVKMNIRV